jgi:hypothetical protein
METIIRKNSKFEILTPDGWSDFNGIRKLKREENIQIILEDFKEIICTPEHLLLTDNGFKTVASINSNDFIVTKQGLKSILSFDFINQNSFFYDPLEVKKNYFYYGNDIVNHNCEFLGSSGTLIAGWKLKELVHMPPVMERDGLIQYFQPEQNNVYMMICDVSRGKGLDYSAFQLINVTKMPYQQTCVFRSNAVTPHDYAGVIHRVAKAYNNASILVEVNDIGEQVSHALHYDFGYEHILFTENAGRSGKRITAGFGGGQVDKGIRTTKVVKSVGCSILKLLVEQNQLIINDFQTINELSTFSKRNNSYEAEPGKNDDLVICLVLFAWLSEQQYFKDYTNINTLASLRDKTEEEIEQDLAPFGFVEMGKDDYTVDDLMQDGYSSDAWMWRPIETLDNF